MIYNIFMYISIFVLCLWYYSVVFRISGKKTIGTIGIKFGLILLCLYLLIYWVHIGRPPFKTMGETRIWYSVFLVVIGLIVCRVWKFEWFLDYSVIVASVFLVIDVCKPDLFDKTLMPALQSPWFIPHVIVYIEGYALLAGAFLCALRWMFSKSNELERQNLIIAADKLIYTGFAFITIGMLFGALWAKVAWGDYWAWDPKETWALITWLAYMSYIHIRLNNRKNIKLAMLFIIVSFITILICWFGMKLLPSAQSSVHIY